MSMSYYWMQHTLSAAYTEYSIHQVQHTPKIVCRPIILLISSWPLNLASASGVPPYRLTATSQFSIRESKVKLPRHIPTVLSQLSDEDSLSTWRASHRSPQINHLQVLLQSRSIIACYKSIRKLARSRPRSVSLSSLNPGLQLHPQTRSITASKCISEFTRPRPLSASPNSLDHGLPVHLWVHWIAVSNCICKLARSRPPSASVSSLSLCLSVHLQTRSITASLCIAELTPSRPPSASPNPLNHGLGVDLSVHSIVISGRTSNCWQSPRAASRDIPCVDR